MAENIELIDKHQRHLRKRGLADGTRKNYRWVLELAAHTGRPLLDLTTDELEDLLHDTERCSELIRSDMAALSSFYKWALHVATLIDVDPTVLMVRPKKRRALPRPCTEDEYRAMLRAAEPDPYMYLLVALAGSAGLRCIEMSRLTHDNMTTAAVRVKGKGDKWRVVPLGSTCAQAVGRIPTGSGPVFGSSPNGLSQRIGRFARRNGMNVTAHQLRHRFATAIYGATTDILVTRDLLGHESVETTQIYTKLDTERLAPAVRALPI